MTKCTDCKKEIETGAIKCSSCGSYQNWKRYLYSGNLIFGFAVIALTLLSIPPIKEFVVGKRANISADVLRVDENKVWVIVSNYGNRPAGIRAIRILKDPDPNSSGPFELVLSYEDIQENIIGVDDVKVYGIEHKNLIPEVAPPGLVTDENWTNCNLSIEYYQLDGHVEIIGNKFTCHSTRLQ